MVQKTFKMYVAVALGAGLTLQAVHVPAVSARSVSYTVKLSPEFFNGHVSLTSRFNDILSKMEDNDVVVQKMNQYLKGYDQQQKEMFIEMLNETTPPQVQGRALLSKVDQAIKLTGLVETDNWLKPEQNNSFTQNLGDSIRSLFKKRSSKEIRTMEELFKAALTGDRAAIEEIHNLAASKSNLSVYDKRKLLGNLQRQAAQLLEEINQKVPEKNRETQDLYLEDLEAQGNAMREIGQQQEANARAVVKYCKDVLIALRPMCHINQHLMSIVDRATLAPLLNVIDFKDFPLQGIRSKDEFARFVEGKVTELHGQGKIQVPVHVETKPLFIKSLQDAILNHHPEIKLPAHTAYESVLLAKERDVALAEQTRDVRARQAEWMQEHVQARLSKVIGRRGLGERVQAVRA